MRIKVLHLLTYSPRADVGGAGCGDVSAELGWRPPVAAAQSPPPSAAACAVSRPLASRTGRRLPPAVATTTVVMATTFAENRAISDPEGFPLGPGRVPHLYEGRWHRGYQT